MGVFRMFVGALAFINYAMIAIDFDAWFTERGYFPVRLAEAWAQGVYRLNFLAGVTDSRITAGIYALVMVAALLTALGLWTRVATIALFLGTVTLHHRNPDILHGGDYLFRAWTFLVMIAPSGHAVSLDRLIGLWKGKAPIEHRPVSIWPQRLVQWQLAVVYFTTVWQKSFGTTWWDGTATHYPLQLREFDRFPLPAFAERQPFIAATTWYTIFIELAMATLVFARPLRKWILLGGLALHAGIEYRLNIPLFAFTICAGYISHYEGKEVTGWFARLGQRFSRWRLSVFRPQGSEPIPERVACLEACDPFRLVSYEKGQEPSWSASKGSPFVGSWLRSPGAWVLGVVPGLWKRMVTRSVKGGSDA